MRAIQAGGGSSAALAALGDQLARAGYLPTNGGSSSALQLQARPSAGRSRREANLAESLYRLPACIDCLELAPAAAVRPIAERRGRDAAGLVRCGVRQLAGAAAGACQYGHASAPRCDPWHECACPCAAQALLASRDGSSNSLSSLGLAGGSHPNLAAAGSLGLPRGGAGAGVGVGRGGAGGSPARTQSSASLGSAGGLLGTGSQHLSASQLLAVQARLRAGPACGERPCERLWGDVAGWAWKLVSAYRGVCPALSCGKGNLLHVLMLP